VATDEPPREKTAEEKAIEKKEKKLRTRTRVAREIYTSERKYCDVLGQLVNLYILPLSANASDPDRAILSQEAIRQIFSNVMLVRGFNNELADSLEACTDPETFDPLTTSVSASILHFVPFLKMYSQYVGNFDAGAAALKKAQKNRGFVAFCEQQQKETGTALQSYLIEPIQRIPRYKLLLEELIRNTEEDHPDYANLGVALASVAEVALSVNNEIKKQEIRMKLIDKHNLFTKVKEGQIISPSRRFVYQGVLTKVCRSSNRPYTFFLFNDKLIYASQSMGRYTIHQDLAINQYFRVEDIVTADQNANNKFQILSQTKSL
jgi:hypothetical protein